jgi:hypothetical protein
MFVNVSVDSHPTAITSGKKSIVIPDTRGASFDPQEIKKYWPGVEKKDLTIDFDPYAQFDTKAGEITFLTNITFNGQKPTVPTGYELVGIHSPLYVDGLDIGEERECQPVVVGTDADSYLEFFLIPSDLLKGLPDKVESQTV